MTRRFNGLAERDRQPELMDQPGLDESLHRHALQGLRRVNVVSGTSRTLWRRLSQGGLAADRPLRLLDVACGSGDVGLGVLRLAKQHGRPAELVGCDVSELAVRVAGEWAAREELAAEFVVRDVLAEPLPTGFDVVICSLFLHHLDSENIVRLLRAMRESGAGRILVSDLLRSRLGYTLCWLGTRLLTRSPIVHVDGPLSVRAALTVDEIRTLADEAGLEGCRITTHWPQRFLLSWSREGDKNA